MDREPRATAVDYDRARAMCSGNDGLLRKLLAHFSEHVGAELSSLAAHVERGEAEPARGVAHKIKGQAASLAIEGVRETALRIEEAAREERLKDAGSDLEELRRRVDEARREIEETTA